jgi:hypothetical protein
MVIQQFMGDFEILRDKNKVKIGKHLHGGDSVIFTPTESEILIILMNNFGKEISIEDICVEVFGWNCNDHGNTFRIHIHHIRKGLSKIDTNYNVTYRNGLVCLQYIEPFNKILDLKKSLHTLLSNEENLECSDVELLGLLNEA